MLFKEKFARGKDSSCKMGVIILSHAANAIEALADDQHKVNVIPHTMAMKEELK